MLGSRQCLVILPFQLKGFSLIFSAYSLLVLADFPHASSLTFITHGFPLDGMERIRLYFLAENLVPYSFYGTGKIVRV